MGRLKSKSAAGSTLGEVVESKAMRGRQRERDPCRRDRSVSRFAFDHIQLVLASHVSCTSTVG